MKPIPPARRLALLALCGLAADALAQADYSEAFEDNGPVIDGQWGPQNLIDRGWIFRNQSDPTNEAAYYDGNNFGGQPLEGEGYLQSDSMATDFLGGALSAWAVLPPIPGQQAGDAISLWLLGGGAMSETYFEIRYSPTGGTSTGSDQDDVGDFTEVLFAAELPIAQHGYRQILETLPGDGRIALRFWAPWIMTAFGRGAYLSLDSLAVGGEPPPPCNVPLPAPGEQIAWTLENSPYTICSDLLIPVGGSVVVEPGVTVTFEEDCRLRVDGELTAHGTPDQPIVFGGDHDPGSGLEISGSADFAFVELGTDVGNPGHEAVLILRDSIINAGVEVWGGPDVAVVERCEFRGGRLGAIATCLRLTDTTFSEGGFANLHGLFYIDNVSIDGGPLLLAGESIAAPNYLANISITNYTGGPGVTAYGNNFMLGPNFVTEGNLYPFSFDILGGGLLRGSKLPASGNIFNHVLAEGLVLGASNRYWADTGIPYVVEGFPDNFGGWLTIEPGTTIKLMPGAGAFFVQDAALVAEGTPDKPIRFEQAQPGAPWFGLKWVDSGLGRQRNVIYDGAEIAIQADGSDLLLDHVTISGSGIGAATQTSGIIHLRGSRVLGNNTGMTTTTTGRLDAFGAVSPNIFAGNGVAVDYDNTDGDVPAFRHNWWNSPTGPTTDQNPGGEGDPVEGLQHAWFSPFLESAPPQNDDPPLVDLEPLYYMVHSRDKIILRWDASDDSAIVSQRVEFANYAHPDLYETVATLGPDDRSYEFTAPVVPPSNQSTVASGIRIVAIDDAGQEWYDEAVIRIPYQEDFTPVHQEIQNIAGVVRPHDWVDICWLPGGTSTIYTAVDDVILTKYHGGAGNCLPNGAVMPFVSTDCARFLVFTSHGAGGRLSYSFSEYFSIRPQELYGDAPPEVTLTSPLGGEQFRGGGVIPLRWTASDDESVRSIGIQASYDAGITWHFVEDELDPSLSSFDWELPPSTGIESVRVRVVATDLRFQNSSATSGEFEILAGDECVADFNGDGTVNTVDVLAFLNAWTAGDASGDLNGDGTNNTLDVLAFLNAWSAGC
jgi:hypothetical protein